MGWIQVPPIPPSEGQDGKLHQLRFLGQVDPDRSVQKGYGNVHLMAVLGAAAIVIMAAAAYLGFQSLANIHVTISNVTVEMGPCWTSPYIIGGTQIANYSVVLANSGSHDAVAVVDLYANGDYVGSTGGITVPAGGTVVAHASAEMYACGAVVPSATLRNVAPTG